MLTVAEGVGSNPLSLDKAIVSRLCSQLYTFSSLMNASFHRSVNVLLAYRIRPSQSATSGNCRAVPPTASSSWPSHTLFLPFATPRRRPDSVNDRSKSIVSISASPLLLPRRGCVGR